MGPSLWLGAHATAGDRGAAPLRVQPGCGPCLVRVSVDRGGEFSPRWDDPREVQRGDPLFGVKRDRRISRQCHWIRMDQRGVSGTAAFAVARMAAEAGAGAGP